MISKPLVHKMTIFALRKIKSNASDGRKKSYESSIQLVCEKIARHMHSPYRLGTTLIAAIADQDGSRMSAEPSTVH